MFTGLASFPEARDLFHREASDGAYGTAAFALQYAALELPCELAAGAVFTAVVAGGCGFRDNAPSIGGLFAVSVCLPNAGESLAQLTLALISDPGLAETVINLALTVRHLITFPFTHCP